MQIEKDAQLNDIIYRHNNQSVVFSMKMYRESRTVRESPSKDPFLVLNRFVQTLTLEEQDIIFDILRDMRNSLDDILDLDELNEILTDKLRELSEIVTVDRCRLWFLNNSGIVIPNTLKRSLDEVDGVAVTEDLTYLREDHIGLSAFSIAMTLISPVFSTYVLKIAPIVGKIYKTFHAYFLLSETTYFTSLELEKLRRYVKATVSANERTLTSYGSIILKGVSSDEYPVWLTALCVIKRVATGDPELMPHPLIVLIHNTILQEMRITDKNFGGAVRDREINEKAGSSEDSEISLLESYRARVPVEDNLIVICETYLKDVKRVCRDLDPTIPVELIEESLEPELLEVLSTQGDIEDAPVTLTKLVIYRVVEARVLDLISKEAVICAMIAVRTFLYHNKFFELAHLATALPIDNEHVQMCTGTEKRSRVIKDLQSKIEVHYPYYKVATGKNKQKSPHSVQITAEYLESLFNTNDWYITSPKSWMSNPLYTLNSRHYALPEGFKVEYINLAMYLQSIPLLPDID